MSASRRIALALIACAALGAGLWLVLAGGGGNDALPAAGPVLGDGPPRPAAVPAPPSEAGASPLVASEYDPEDEDQDLAGALDDGEGGEPLFALILGEDQQAIAGATVAIHAGDGDGSPFRRGRAAAPRVLRTVTSNREGLALLSPHPRGRFLIEARSGERAGAAWFEPDEEAREALALPDGAAAVVVLRPVRALEVTLVDGAGIPVPGIEVSVRHPNDGGGPGFGGNRGGPRGEMRPSTASVRSRSPDGVARVEITAADDRLYGAGAVAVEAALVGLDPVAREIALDPAGVTHATLTLPPTVALTVRLLDPLSSQLVTKPMELSWMVLPGEEGAERLDGRMLWRQNRFGSEEVAAGIVTIAGLRPGARVRLGATGDERVPVDLEVRLPESERETSRDLVVGRRQATVVARLLEPDGRPAARERVFLRVPGAEPDVERGVPMMTFLMQREETRRTDKDGRLRVPVIPGSSARLELHAASGGGRGGRRGGPEAREAKPLATLSVPVLDSEQVHDAGDVTLDRGPIALAGRVVTSAGLPLAEVRIDPRARERNPAFPLRETTAGEGGRFTIYGDAGDAEEIAVTATARGGYRGVAAAPPGTTDLVVVMRRTGGLSGRARLADPTLPARLELRAEPEDGERGARAQARADQRDQARFDQRAQARFDQRIQARLDQRTGTFTVTGLLPGRWRIVASIDGQEALRIHDLLVPEGEVAAPGALQDLVVGADFVDARVLVRDPDGAPVAGAQVVFAVSDDEAVAGGRGRRETQRGRARVTDAQGSVRYVVRAGTVQRLTVQARGFAEARVERPVFPAEVVLEREKTLTLRFSAPLPASAEIGRYAISLVPAGEAEDGDAMPFGPMRGNGSTAAVEAGADAVELRGAGAGRFKVVARALPAGRRPPNPELFRRGRIDLGEVTISRGAGDAVEARLEIDPAAILKVLQAPPAR